MHVSHRPPGRACGLARAGTRSAADADDEGAGGETWYLDALSLKLQATECSSLVLSLCRPSRIRPLIVPAGRPR
jgi:hypothetical protein